jgi:hypothetical protein
MAGSAAVFSIEALEILNRALKRFASRTEEYLESVAPEIERGIEILEERRQQWARILLSWQEEYDSADPEEDDLDYIACKIEEAEEHLSRLETWQSRVEESQQKFLNRASQLGEFASTQAVEAQTFLSEKIDLIRKYHSIPVGSGAAGSASSSVGSSQISSKIAGSQLANELMALPLPDGFRWINLDEISSEAMSELPTESDFRKVEYNEVVRGFNVLKDEILPLLQQTPQNANSDYFGEQDRNRGFDESNGARRVFDAFFGSDPIYLERASREGKFNITNGRHRIRVAQDLGFNAIPAKIAEDNSNGQHK